MLPLMLGSLGGPEGMSTVSALPGMPPAPVQPGPQLPAVFQFELTVPVQEQLPA